MAMVFSTTSRMNLKQSLILLLKPQQGLKVSEAALLLHETVYCDAGIECEYISGFTGEGGGILVNVARQCSCLTLAIFPSYAVHDEIANEINDLIK